MKILARLALRFLATHFGQEALHFETRRGLRAAILLPPRAPLFSGLYWTRLEPDLLEYSHQKLVHLVIEATGRLDILTVVGISQI